VCGITLVTLAPRLLCGNTLQNRCGQKGAGARSVHAAAVKKAHHTGVRHTKKVINIRFIFKIRQKNSLKVAKKFFKPNQ
jgi:hypothetical protein